MCANELSGQTNVINSNNIAYDKSQGYCAQTYLNTDKIEAVKRIEKRSRRKCDREPYRDFNEYRGPSISESVPGCVPICPITITSQTLDNSCLSNLLGQ